MKLLATITTILLVALSPLSVAGDLKTHYPGIFVGMTKFDGHNDFTLGVEYEYRINSRWGVGAAYERINDAHKGDGATVWTAMGFYHPINQVKLGLGFGEEKVGGGYQKDETLIRLAIAYEFHITDGVELAPTLDFDFIDGKVATVAGLAIVFPF